MANRIISVIIPLILVSLSVRDAYGQAQYLVINEMMSSNIGTPADEDGEFSDWIEIYNAGSLSVNLAGFGLSDDPEMPFRWTFPDVDLQAGTFLLVWASGKNRVDPQKPLHTGFSISSGGEHLLLTDPEGILIDALPPVALHGDVSYGRSPGTQDEFVYFLVPTPGYANHDVSFSGIMDPPALSVPSGFYQGTMDLGISHADPEAVIRYTVDNSVPDEGSYEYNGPLMLESLEGSANGISMIPTNPPDVRAIIAWKPPAGEVDKAHIIRAVATKPGYIPSPAVTASYFINQPVPALPVISIVTDNDNLFDHHDGIYIPGIVYEQNGYGEGWYGQPNANYFRRGDEWEVHSFLEFIEDGEPVLAQDVGIRIHGGGTRALPMKSLRVYARGGYGNEYLDHVFFPGQDDSRIKRLILRNGGQDFFGPGTLLRDGFMHRLAEPVGLAIQDYRPAIVFLNGEYWGIHNIRERYDHHYFERRYDIPEDNLDFLESNQRVLYGSSEHYSDMISFVEQNPLSDNDAYRQLQTLMDTDNYTDFFVVNIFYNNIDWPGHNLKYWRYSGETLNNPPHGKDGRWRWAFNDFDFGFGYTEGEYPNTWNTLVHATHPDGGEWPPNPPWSTFLIRKLLENEDFRNGFVNRFGDLLNSIFRTGYMTAFLDELKKETEPEMSRHISRWNYPATDMDEWGSNIARMIRFAERRPEYQVNHILDYFGLDGTFSLTLDVNDPDAGTVLVNRLLLEAGGLLPETEGNIFPWNGSYFKGIPLPVKAIAGPGHEFIRWVNGQGDEFTENPLIINSGTDLSLTAVFGPRENFFPEPYIVSEGDWHLFTRWDDIEAEGTFPPHMAFVYMDEADPGIEAFVEGYTWGRYDLDNRTRVNGLGCGGVSFINTGNADGNPGYPGVRMGGAVLAIDTRGAENVHIMFEAGTVLRNSRIYNMRLQYRLGDNGPFIDFPGKDGGIVGYVCASDGHSVSSEPLPLPEQLTDQPYIQLLWRYYFTGVQEDGGSGQRSQLRLANIAVFQGESFPAGNLVAAVYLEEQEGVLCDNDTVSLRAEYADGTATAIYRWFVDNEHVFSGSTAEFNLAGPRHGSLIRVEVSDANSCLIGLPAVSNEISLDVTSSPETPVITFQDSLLLSSAGNGNQWYEATTGLIDGADQQQFAPSSTGSYYVIVSDALCSSYPSEPYVFEIADIDSVQSISGDRPVIYPNPVRSALYIKINDTDAGILTWQVYEPGGRLMDSDFVQSTAGEAAIDVSGLGPGLYVLRIIYGNEVTLFRFIRE